MVKKKLDKVNTNMDKQCKKIKKQYNKEEEKDMEETPIMRISISDLFSENIQKVKLFIENLLIQKSSSYDLITELKKEMTDIKFEYNIYIEDDKSYTLSLKDIDIVVNEKTYDKALDSLISELKEYSSDYCNDLDYWYSAPNRRSHCKYVVKALIYDKDELKRELVCRNGRI